MNSVDFLLTNKDITYEIRTEIKGLGRPRADLIISKTDVGKSRNYSRNFNSSVYDIFKWLCGCPKRNELFCFICLVMGGNQSAWTQEGQSGISALQNKRVLDDVHSFSFRMKYLCLHINDRFIFGQRTNGNPKFIKY
ncbi:hypothetical protein NQ318_019328 [Aromia moschata]|uniref:Uncharacterized protein n=1 Tax=Aromia moschata TaxID=1265417 RepID=A0AAV8YBA1_9CUCU|nr:hypothetical protein NQ318_019328 [Aromia moschata]